MAFMLAQALVVKSVSVGRMPPSLAFSQEHASVGQEIRVSMLGATTSQKQKRLIATVNVEGKNS